MIAVALAAVAFAAVVAVLALRLIVTERDAFRLERIGRLERHHTQITKLLAEHRADMREIRAEHRADMRELLTRVTHPQLVPQAVRAAAPPRPQNASERARAAWTGIGRAAPPESAAPTDEVGDDVP